MDYSAIAHTLGVSPSTAEKALNLAIERALKNHIDITNVRVCLDEKTVSGTFRVPMDISMADARLFDFNVIELDPVHAVFDLASFSPAMVETVRKYLIFFLHEIQGHENYDFWSQRVRTIQEGVIKDADRNQILVDVDGFEALFPRECWVPGEKQHYTTGSLMSFYVSKVVRRSAPPATVSRGARNFAALLMRHRLPWYNFICPKRYRGQKSFIFTNAPMDRALKIAREEVSQELFGEVIEVRDMSKYANWRDH